MAKKSVIRKGKAAMESASGSSDFVRIGDGDAVDMVSLVDMEELLSIDQHAIWLDGGNSPMFPCIGTKCPGEEMGNTPRFRAFLPVVVVDNGEQKIFSFGISIARALEELDDEFDGLTGHVFRVKRKGAGLATTYTVIAMGRKRKIDKYELPDIEEKLGPTTRAGILALLSETGALEDSVESDEEEIEEEIEEEEEEEEKAPPKARSRRKAKPKAEEAEDEDWEDV